MTGRVTVLWFPDWPVYAAGQMCDWHPLAPAAIITEHRVKACNAPARKAGVKQGMKQRHALSLCPQLLVAEDDEAKQLAVHESVVIAIEEVAAGVETLRPGLLAFPADPLSRYYGSEDRAVELLLDAAVRMNADCLAGTADDVVTAVWAAQQGRSIAPGGGAEFVAGLPVEVMVREASLGEPQQMVTVLRQLGIRTLRDFAALPRTDVAARFGAEGVDWHRIACGDVDREVAPQREVPAIEVRHEVEDPISRTETAAFVARHVAARLHGELFAAGDACLRLAVRAYLAVPAGYEGPTMIERVWRCREPLTEEDTAQRVRWQLEGWITRLRGAGLHGGAGVRGGGDADVRGAGAVIGGGSGVHGADATGDASDGEDGIASAIEESWEFSDEPVGVEVLELVPVETVPAGHVEIALWGGPDEGIRAARAAAGRAQALIGVQNVLRPIHRGGRAIASRVVTVPYGDEDPEQVTALPTRRWSGELLRPLPSVVGTYAGGGSQVGSRLDARKVAQVSGRTDVREGARATSPTGAQVGSRMDVQEGARATSPTSVQMGQQIRSRRNASRGSIGASGQSNVAQPREVMRAPSAAHPVAKIEVCDADGVPVYVSGRGLLSGHPRFLRWGSRTMEITGWAGPWPVDERWWARGKRYARMQISTDEPGAYLLVSKDTAWRIEATY